MDKAYFKDYLDFLLAHPGIFLIYPQVLWIKKKNILVITLYELSRTQKNLKFKDIKIDQGIQQWALSYEMNNRFGIYRN